jgi:hypothetical protein
MGVGYLSLKEQNCWLITCQTISSEDMLGEVSSRRTGRFDGCSLQWIEASENGAVAKSF